MPIEAHVPEELTHGPFTVADALRAGLTRRRLQGRSWRRVGRGLYVWAGTRDDLALRIEALHRRLPPDAAFSHRTAGWLHGLDVEPGEPPEATAPVGCGVSNRAGVRLRRSTLAVSDISRCHGLPTTSPLRTAFDLARHLPLVEAVVAVDAAMRHMLVDLAGLGGYVAAHQRAQGAAQAFRVVELAEPRAESQMDESAPRAPRPGGSATSPRTG
jgi:hypothetical protein